jgi:hypothetical protein
MKRATFIVVVFFAALLGAALGTRAVAQGEKPSPYEYMVFNVEAREFRTKDDWKAILEKNAGNELKADAEFKGYVLNTLAKDGWELVHVAHPVKEKNELTVFYLRRTRG